MKRHTLWFCFALALFLIVGCQPMPLATVSTPEPIAELTHTPMQEPAATPLPAPTQEPTAEVVAEAPVVLELVGPDGSEALTMADLKALPAVEGWGGIKSSTGQITLPSQFKGVTIEELSALVGALDENTGVNVVAKDGYAMTFSYDQISRRDLITYDPATGEEIAIDAAPQLVLAYEQDGQPISETTEGPLRIVALTSKNNQVVDGHWSVKWVQQIALKSLAQDWSLHMQGALDEEIDRGTFESCAAPGCHQASWTDEKAQQWTGVPLWLLLGYVDNDMKHGDDAYAEALAEQGYPVEVIAADDYSVAFDSTRLHRNDDILVADKVNGNPLEDKYFPLRLVGPDLQKNEMVGQIVQILLDLSSQAPEPTPAPTEMPATEVPSPEPSAGQAALTLAGALEQEKAFSLEALKAMDVVEISTEHPKKGMETNQGVRLNAILELAGVQAGATQLIATASDGYQAEISLADVSACADCMVAFADGDTLKLVMPGMESSLWVKDVVQLELR